MSAAVLKTLNGANTTGYVVALGRPCAYVQITSKSDFWVQTVYVDAANGDSPPTAPLATPAPGAGLTADWIHLASAGDKLPVDWRDGGTQSLATDMYTHVVVWCVTAGELLIYAR